jgi:hypothetical protein
MKIPEIGHGKTSDKLEVDRKLQIKIKTEL